MEIYNSVIAKYVSEIESSSKELSTKHDFDNPVLFYRGVNFPVKLENDVPKLFRTKYDGCRRNEDKIVRDVINNRPSYFSDCKSTVERLEIMQHNGLPTRLLDITKNYLVALYFACLPRENISKHASVLQPEESGRVFIYVLDEKNVLYDDDDLVSCLANISLMPAEFNAFGNNCDGCKKLLSRVKSEHPWVKQIKHEWLDGYIVCVDPKKSNSRMIAQDGAFFLFGIQNGIKNEFVRIFSEKSNKHVWVSTIDIDKDDKKDILCGLDRMGINEEVLFPELEHYKAKIERKYRV